MRLLVVRGSGSRGAPALAALVWLAAAGPGAAVVLGADGADAGGVAVNGVAVGGAAVDRWAVGGVAVDSMAVVGAAVDGPAVDRMAVGGVAVDSAAVDREAVAAGPGRPGLLSTLGGDAQAAGRTFSLFVRREVWPRSAGQLVYLGSLAGVSAILEHDKEALRRDVLRSSFYRHSHWTQIGGTLGLTRVGYGAAGALYLGGLAIGEPEVRRTGMLMAESLLVAQGVAGAVNFAVSEQRPQAGGAIRFFHSGGSGVSIHMTNTTALARVLDHRFARFAPDDSRGRRLAKILGKVLIYSIPTITGWQRLRADQHYLWNVVLGAGLSAYVTDALLRSYDQVAAPPAR